MNMLIMGCGYLGRRVAARCRSSDGVIRGLVRSAESARLLKGLGIEAVVSDLDHPPLPEFALAGAAVFYFLPPVQRGGKDQRVRNLVASFSEQGSPARIVYLSTSGVYGDCAGDWVDESRPAAPATARSRRRLDAEQMLSGWRKEIGGELIILRVAGIYGPGRLPLERLRKRLPMVREQEAPFSNRIHIDDLTKAAVAAMERGRDGEIYNVSDGHPTTMTDYFNQLADLARLPRPPQIRLSEGESHLTAGMLSYMHESRRLDNRKMRQELGVALDYPDIRTGLPACLGGKSGYQGS